MNFGLVPPSYRVLYTNLVSVNPFVTGPYFVRLLTWFLEWSAAILTAALGGALAALQTSRCRLYKPLSSS